MSATAPRLETERLVLRMFREGDFEAFARIGADPDVARYLGNGLPLTRQEAWRSLAAHLGHWTLRGYGMFAIEEKATGEFVGRAGFFNPEGWPGFELGWTLARERWGRGYATEAARRLLDHAFAEMGRDHVISVIQPENAASIRVAERIGERLERTTELSGREVLIYGIDRGVWLQSPTSKRA
ncbi:MAG TPA: GNAT family N-acetyltransferase [Candidatus Eisenbacteria bacterium]|nr:GNAT family N-acetyltransferase [Candidatus Eisenbacteria bacterium]